MAGFKTSIAELIMLSIIGSVLTQEFHETLTSEERAELFPMASTEFPEYEVMPIHKSRVQRRVDGKISMKMQVFGQNIKLWLNPLNSILVTAETPVYTITEGMNLQLHPGEMAATIRKMYEDVPNAATISINDIPGGKVELNGIIGTQHIHLRPVPRKFLNNVKRYRRSIDKISESDIDNYTYHIAYKIPETTEYLKIHKAPLTNTLRSKRGTPSVIYPEIMVIIDYSLYKLLNEDFYTALSYTVAFWNGVDLKYRAFQYPSIRLNIAGVILATEPSSLEYTQYRAENGDLLISDALDGSTNWIMKLKNKLYPDYSDFDVTVTLIAGEFCQMRGDKCEQTAHGMAYGNGACSIYEYEQTQLTYSTAIVRDISSFDGIVIAAHELAHLMGAYHDGEFNNCERGYIMSPEIGYNSHMGDFSNCSLKEMEQYMKSNPTCLYNIPRGKGKLVPRFLPGKLKDANEQCRILIGTQASFINDTICKILFCDQEQYMIPHQGAVDGTPCGTGKICLHGHCIREIYTRFYIPGRNDL